MPLLLLLVLVVCLSAIVLRAIDTAHKSSTTTHDERVSLDSIVTCIKNTGSVNTIMCERGAIKNLLQSHTTQELMDSIATDASPVVRDVCHGIAHIIGEQTFETTPSLEQALERCSSLCGYGCIHGVIAASMSKEFGEKSPKEDIEHASGAEIKEVGGKYCNNTNACHAIGHLLYIAYGTYPQSLHGCDDISTNRSRENCYRGVFMQGIGGTDQSLVLGDTAPPVAKVPTDDYTYPCGSVGTAYHHACFQNLAAYQDILFSKIARQDAMTRIDVAKKVCESYKGADRGYCFEGIGLNMGTGIQKYYPLRPGAATTECKLLPTTDDQNACMLGHVFSFTRISHFEAAADYCSAQKGTDKQTCYNMIFTFTGTDVCSTLSAPKACKAAMPEYEQTKNTLPQYYFGLQGKI